VTLWTMWCFKLGGVCVNFLSGVCILSDVCVNIFSCILCFLVNIWFKYFVCIFVFFFFCVVKILYIACFVFCYSCRKNFLFIFGSLRSNVLTYGRPHARRCV
jgi:hypothetical protein